MIKQQLRNISTLKQRAKRITMVFTDCDGVLTDGGVYYTPQGELMKKFSLRDGMGVERLRQEGIEVGIMSGETSESIIRRAEKLRLNHCYLGVKNKLEKLQEILQHEQLTPDQLAYIGDDVNDLPIIREINAKGLTGAPKDAMTAIIREVHYITAMPGGNGAFREFAEWIITLRSSESVLVNPIAQLIQFDEDL